MKNKIIDDATAVRGVQRCKIGPALCARLNGGARAGMPILCDVYFTLASIGPQALALRSPPLAAGPSPQHKLRQDLLGVLEPLRAFFEGGFVGIGGEGSKSTFRALSLLSCPCRRCRFITRPPVLVGAP